MISLEKFPRCPHEQRCFMTDREVWQLAKDLVDTFMPTKGKTGEQIIAEIHRVYADLSRSSGLPRRASTTRTLWIRKPAC